MDIERPTRHSSFAQIISLGRDCQAAHQIRRFTGNEKASYFDWLGTPHDAMISTLRRNFAGCFERKNLMLSSDTETVIDTFTGISYRHSFPRLPGSRTIDAEAIDRNYVSQAEKMHYLASRWRENAANTPILFVRKAVADEEQALELGNALRENLAHEEFLLLFLVPLLPPRQTAYPHIRFAFESDDNRLSEQWQGSDLFWDRLLETYGCSGILSRQRAIVARDLFHSEFSTGSKNTVPQ